MNINQNKITTSAISSHYPVVKNKKQLSNAIVPRGYQETMSGRTAPEGHSGGEGGGGQSVTSRPAADTIV